MSGRTAVARDRVTHVALFGEFLLDCFGDREVEGGAPFNVACHLHGLGRAIGVRPLLLSRVGADERGQKLLEILAQAHIPRDGVQLDPAKPTGTARIDVLADGRHDFVIHPGQAWDAIDGVAMGALLRTLEPSRIYFGTLVQRGASRLALREFAEHTRAWRFLDLNLRAPWFDREVLNWSLAHAETVKLNVAELLELGRLLFDGLPGTPKSIASRVIDLPTVRRVVVTEGEHGAWALDAVEGYLAVPRRAGTVKVVDTVGAGDAFSSVLLLGDCLDWPLGITLERAGELAAEVCGMRGAVPSDPGFHARFVSRWGIDGAGW